MCVRLCDLRVMYTRVCIGIRMYIYVNVCVQTLSVMGEHKTARSLSTPASKLIEL